MTAAYNPINPISFNPEGWNTPIRERGIFNAGNEFRSLDIKSMRYQTENIASIEFQNPYYHVFMKPDKAGPKSPILVKPILTEDIILTGKKPMTSIQKRIIYLCISILKLPMLYTADNVFVTGALSDWATMRRNQMKYNEENKSI